MTAREALVALPVRATYATALTAVVIAAWAVMWAQSGGMSSMSDGLLVATCESMPMTVHAGSFLLMWTVMVAAMMLPGEAATLVSKGRVTFAAGYLTVWLLVGPLALAAVHLSVTHPGVWAAHAAAAVFVVAGLYQFTPVKITTLDVCRRRDVPSTAVGGIRHGAFCFGANGLLMAVMLVVGVMNLAWCALIALAMTTEKHLGTGRRAVAIAFGVVLVAIGVSIATYPSILPDIAMRGM